MNNKPSSSCFCSICEPAAIARVSRCSVTMETREPSKAINQCQETDYKEHNMSQFVGGLSNAHHVLPL